MTQETQSPAIAAIAEDKDIIPYRKKLREITDSVTAAILLQQMIFNAKREKWKPFYKLKEPCSHKAYREGDSWTEELGFSRREFDGALEKIATKVNKTTKEKVLKEQRVESLIVYWTDTSRLTWYEVNWPLLNTIIEKIYTGCDISFIRNGGKRLYVNSSLRKGGKRLYVNSSLRKGGKRLYDTAESADTSRLTAESAFTSNKEAETSTETTSETISDSVAATAATDVAPSGAHSAEADAPLDETSDFDPPIGEEDQGWEGEEAKASSFNQTGEAKAKATVPKRKGTRQKHEGNDLSRAPEIQLYRRLTGYYPHGDSYSYVISCLKDHTQETASPYYAKWANEKRGRGTGWLEWAKNRMPLSTRRLTENLQEEIERGIRNGVYKKIPGTNSYTF